MSVYFAKIVKTYFIFDTLNVFGNVSARAEVRSRDFLKCRAPNLCRSLEDRNSYNFWTKLN